MKTKIIQKLLEKITNKKINKTTILGLGFFGGALVITFLVLAIVILCWAALDNILGFDFHILEKDESGDVSEYYALRVKDDRLEEVEDDLNAYYSSKTDNNVALKIDSALIGATIQTTLNKNPTLEYDFSQYTGMGSEIKSDYPSYDLLYEMADAMVLTRVTKTCVEVANPGGESYKISYLKELIGMYNQEQPACKPKYEFLKEYDKEGNLIEDITYVSSNIYYTEVYLYEFFAKNTPVLLEKDSKGELLVELYEADATEDIAAQLREDNLELYSDYLDFIEQSNYERSTEINYVNTPSLISDNFAYSLPLYLCDMTNIRNENDGKDLGIYDHCRYGSRITSDFGERDNPTNPGTSEFHGGVDLGCAEYNPDIYSVMSGTVKSVIYDEYNSYGNRVWMLYDTDFDGDVDSEIVYAHLAQVFVNPGDELLAGDSLGLCGESGNSTGKHLHFEIRKNGVSMDPINNNGILEKAWQSIFNTEY